MGKKSAEKKKRSKAGRIIRKTFLVLLLLFFITVLVLGIIFYNKYGKRILELKREAEKIAATSERSDFRASETSICYFSDGSVMSVLKGEKDVYYLEYDAIPKYCINALLATEDRKFYEHAGYDVYAILRAAKAYLDNEGEIRQGGSTITQQLARTIYLNNEKTIERKVKEIFLAANLEKKYSKKDILEFYLNNIYFANGYYGLQAASYGYFGKPVGELSLSEAAFICGIPNSPADYNPKKRYDNAVLRRDSVLKQMQENGYISKDEYNEAIAETIVLKSSSREIRDYAETFTYYCTVRMLMKQEGFTFRNDFTSDEDKDAYEDLYEEEYYRIKRSLYTKGYRIYTSINPEKQALLQQTIDDGLSEYDEKQENGVYALQASAVCIDNETGYVVAEVGGRQQTQEGYTLNRAFQSPRQPGSSIKPLVVYTPIFERGYYPDTKVIDEKFEGGPRNSGGVYSGEIDLRYAVSVSKNTVAWKIFEELTPRVGLDYLKRMNFGSLVQKDYVPAASLGGLTYGVTALEMASAYATIYYDGLYRDPTCILRITDSDGELLSGGYGNENDRKRIYEVNASRIMTDVLKTVMTSGTGRKLAIDGITCAGKTGTTENQRDGWFVGFTGYYTTAVWVGYDYPREMKELMGNTYPGYIWQDYMTKIHEGLEDKEFKSYTDNRIPIWGGSDNDDYPNDDTDDNSTGIGADGYDENTGMYTGIDETSGFSGKLIYIGEDGSRIILSEDISDDTELDREGKPVYFDDEGNRYLYDEKGKRVEVGADGYPEGYALPGGWTLYDKDGNPVMKKTEGVTE
ncbi:MAG: PBP1A family penicillin-binding protein [Lachnospiraceae bacterium]|nr:PBP1A family penicillin-binding protein [Lachnospiraceae bacterium]